MAPGSFNGKNYGGLHTGTGKYQNGGVYSNDGYRKQVHKSSEFTVGKRVAYIGSHKNFRGSLGEGQVLSTYGDKVKPPRSVIKVLLSDSRVTYFHKNSLVFM